MNMPPRGSVAAADADARRRQPFHPLQHLRASRSPFLPTKSIRVDTPPREVILTPRATPKPIKRKPSSRLKRAATKVKSEPPEINLSRVRPPSPTDDPLLLSGTPPIRSPPLRARLTPVFSSSPSDTTDLVPSLSFTARLFDNGARIDAFSSGSSPSAGELEHALPMFGTLRTFAEPGSPWSDSDDDDGFNLTGEYTGKYKLLQVPTKVEPPRRETSWGRPVSPFPYSEIMERSLPLSEIGEDDEGRADVLDPMEDVWVAPTSPPLSDVELSPPPEDSEDEFAYLDKDFPVFDLDAQSTQVRPLIEPLAVCSDPDAPSLEEEEEEAQIDRELSVAVDDGGGLLDGSYAVQPTNAIEDDSSDEEDDVDGEDIIKITSDDPKAAARAAAILRMHDYDCILAAEKKKRSSRSNKLKRQRRKTIESAGISKSYIDLKSQSWDPPQGDTSPGSRSLPLLELWRDAEDSVFLEHHSMSYCDASFTLSPLKAMAARPEPILPPLTGEWNRDCWKCLDKCLVAEQLAVAAARGLGTDVLADIGDISTDDVLGRFMTQLGGESVVASLGPAWSRKNLMLRLDVLIKKQSRRKPHAPTSVHQDPTELRYRGLLQEAMALSRVTEGSTFMPIVSNSTTVSDQLAARKTNQSYSDLSWRSILPSWLGNHARSLIRTPSRTPDPRHPHPRDQVHLRHLSVAHKSQIPVPIRPKRLVDLRHRSPTKADRSVRRPTGRRNSGCNVRDLVQQFESLDR